MELSGLIFVALALVWAAVLIPMALRQHDETARTRGLENFSDDLRVVARREASGEGSGLVVPPRARRDTGAASEPRATPSDLLAFVATHRRAAVVAARRRRRVLTVLVLATGAVVAAAWTGLLLPWAPAVPAAVTVGFLVLARVLVRRERRAWEQSVERRRRAHERRATEVAVAVPAAAAAASEATGPHRLDLVCGLEETTAVPVTLSAPVTAAAEGLWDPLPVTLPTYVSKPRAHRSVRTIDLQDAGVMSSGRDAASSALVAEAASAATGEATAPVDLPAVGS